MGGEGGTPKRMFLQPPKLSPARERAWLKEHFATMATRLGSAFGRAFKATAPKLQAPQLPVGRRNVRSAALRPVCKAV